MARDTMLFWLARAVREARTDAGLKLVRVGAAVDRDQSAIARFEQGKGWPREPDRFVAGYAEETGISQIEIWRRALELWEQAEAAGVTREVGEAHEAAAETSQRRGGNGQRRGAKGNQSEAG